MSEFKKSWNKISLETFFASVCLIVTLLVYYLGGPRNRVDWQIVVVAFTLAVALFLSFMSVFFVKKNGLDMFIGLLFFILSVLYGIKFFLPPL